MRKIKEPIWFYTLIVCMFFVTMGLIASVILSEYDYWNLIEVIAFCVGIYELRRIWKDANCTKDEEVKG